MLVIFSKSSQFLFFVLPVLGLKTLYVEMHTSSLYSWVSVYKHGMHPHTPTALFKYSNIVSKCIHHSECSGKYDASHCLKLSVIKKKVEQNKELH